MRRAAGCEGAVWAVGGVDVVTVGLQLTCARSARVLGEVFPRSPHQVSFAVNSVPKVRSCTWCTDET